MPVVQDFTVHSLYVLKVHVLHTVVFADFLYVMLHVCSIDVPFQNALFLVGPNNAVGLI